MIESLAETVREGLEEEFAKSNLPEITCAASLANHRLLGSVKEMSLWDVDLTSVPAEHLASLFSSVIWRVFLRNVSGCGLVTILDNVKSELLDISSQESGQ